MKIYSSHNPIVTFYLNYPSTSSLRISFMWTFIIEPPFRGIVIRITESSHKLLVYIWIKDNTHSFWVYLTNFATDLNRNQSDCTDFLLNICRIRYINNSGTFLADCTFCVPIFLLSFCSRCFILLYFTHYFTPLLLSLLQILYILVLFLPIFKSTHFFLTMLCLSCTINVYRPENVRFVNSRETYIATKIVPSRKKV